MGTPILTYHSIDASGSIISLAPATFARQMETLRQLGYRGVSVREWLDHPGQGGPPDGSPPGRPCVITFDDGYQNNLTHALPVLKQCGFGATVFLSTGVGPRNDWVNAPGVPSLPMLTWPEVRELEAAGIDIQSHGHRHVPLNRLGAADIQTELTTSRQLIAQHVPRPADVLCYPYGAYNEDVIRAAKACGFRAAVTTRFGWNAAAADRYRIERVPTQWFRKFPSFFPVLLRHWGSPVLLPLIRVYVGMRKRMRKGQVG
ncbi:MAG: polysaccharide deacetylase family protein [Lentisphaerae bacterium]|nr:polysaccharide deacetylase family protein [Lentisphaerota bacterium]